MTLFGLARQQCPQLKGEGDPLELYRVLDFFEIVGLLVSRGYLNEEDVWRQFECDGFLRSLSETARMANLHTTARRKAIRKSWLKSEIPV